MPNNSAKAAVILAWIFGTACAALAASDFEGTWNVKDTAGKSFQIVLSSDGVAKGTRAEGMGGTWKEDGDTAVITWDTGWVTKIVEENAKYKKMAYRKGQALEGPPASDAMRKLMIVLTAAMLGMAFIPSTEASAHGWHGHRHGWNHRGWHGHRGGWGHHRRCSTHWVNGRRVTRCW
jgi:hypothetical protein